MDRRIVITGMGAVTPFGAGMGSELGSLSCRSFRYS